MQRLLLRSAATLAIVLAPALASAQAPGGGERGGGASERGGGDQKMAPSGAGSGAATKAPEAGEPRGGAPKGGEPKTAEPKTAEPKSGEPKAGEPKTGAKEPKAGTPGSAAQRGDTEKGGGASQHSKTDEKRAGTPAEKGGAPGAKGGNAAQKGAGGRDKGAAGGKSVQITSEQRTRITTTIRSQHVEALHDVSFAISVGTIVPRRYTYHPLPADIIEIVPEYRGFDYVLVNSDIIIIDPASGRIVEIIS